MKKVINIPPFIIVHRCTRSKALCVPTSCGMNAACTRRGKCEKAGPRDLSIMNNITMGFGQWTVTVNAIMLRSWFTYVKHILTCETKYIKRCDKAVPPSQDFLH